MNAKISKRKLTKIKYVANRPYVSFVCVWTVCRVCCLVIRVSKGQPKLLITKFLLYCFLRFYIASGVRARFRLLEATFCMKVLIDCDGILSNSSSTKPIYFFLS